MKHHRKLDDLRAGFKIAEQKLIKLGGIATWWAYCGQGGLF
jgi:hypothetical protein